MDKVLCCEWIAGWGTGAATRRACPICRQRHRLLAVGGWVHAGELRYYYQCGVEGRYLRVVSADDPTRWQPRAEDITWDEANGEMLALIGLGAEQFF